VGLTWFGFDLLAFVRQRRVTRQSHPVRCGSQRVRGGEGKGRWVLTLPHHFLLDSIGVQVNLVESSWSPGTIYFGGSPAKLLTIIHMESR
jgi:hypothetical protein